MTARSGREIDQIGPLTIWEALKLAEDRNAYGTIAVEGRPDQKFHVFNGRLLTTDDTGESLDLVQAIASILSARDHCWLLPMCDVTDAQTRSSVAIAESLVASVRLTAVSATLAFNTDEVRDEFVPSTVAPASNLQPGAAAGSDTEELLAGRKAEADRLRAEFFERRSHRRQPKPGAMPPRMAPVSRPAAPVMEERRAAAIADRLAGVTDASLLSGEPRRGLAAEPEPVQRTTALRSLIRNLMS